MDLRSKLTSDICQKVRSLDRKKRKKVSKHSLCHLFLKKLLYLLKSDILLTIFYSKNKCTYKFYEFANKSAFGNMSLSTEFRFKNSLYNYGFFQRTCGRTTILNGAQKDVVASFYCVIFIV